MVAIKTINVGDLIQVKHQGACIVLAKGRYVRNHYAPGSSFIYRGVGMSTDCWYKIDSDQKQDSIVYVPLAVPSGSSLGQRLGVCYSGRVLHVYDDAEIAAHMNASRGSLLHKAEYDRRHALIEDAVMTVKETMSCVSETFRPDLVSSYHPRIATFTRLIQTDPGLLETMFVLYIKMLEASGSENGASSIELQHAIKTLRTVSTDLSNAEVQMLAASDPSVIKVDDPIFKTGLVMAAA